MVKTAKSKWPDVQAKLLLVEAWARDGLTDAQIATNLGISERTLNDYKIKYPQFLQSIKKSKEVADVIIENAMYKRAAGYEYKEITTEIETSASGAIISRKAKEVTKQIAPDVGAGVWWLKNRKPDVWKQHRREQDDAPPLPDLSGLIKALSPQQPLEKIFEKPDSDTDEKK